MKDTDKNQILCKSVFKSGEKQHRGSLQKNGLR